MNNRRNKTRKYYRENRLKNLLKNRSDFKVIYPRRERWKFESSQRYLIRKMNEYEISIN